MRALLLTEHNKGLLGGIRLELLLRMTVVVDNPAGVGNSSAEGEVGEPPSPSQGPSQLARPGLRSLVGVGSSEGDATRVAQLHGNRRSSGGLGDGGEGASRNATAGGHLADPGEGHHGSRGGSHCEGLEGERKLN